MNIGRCFCFEKERGSSGNSPTPSIENKLRELALQPVFESAREKTHMFIDFLKQTQDVESAIMMTECADSIIRDSKEVD